LSRAARVVVASPQKLALGGVSFEYANELVFGLARIRASQLDAHLQCVAVWDRKGGDGAGGTATAVHRWQQSGLTAEIIDVWRTARDDAGQSVAAIDVVAVGAYRGKNNGGSKVRAMLFADAVGFSKLEESDVPLFVARFIGKIAELVAQYGEYVLARNTWGDGFYFVFSSVESAGKFALNLSDLVSVTDWTQQDLPADLNLRIALHAGPVYEEQDPITGQQNFYGTHVSRAARIEPITPPGSVYASEAFAALAAAQQASGFRCEYAGQTPMAKGFGTFPTYGVTRTRAFRQ
jgi:class 3 adenylate cyclase